MYFQNRRCVQRMILQDYVENRWIQYIMIMTGFIGLSHTIKCLHWTSTGLYALLQIVALNLISSFVFRFFKIVCQWRLSSLCCCSWADYMSQSAAIDYSSSSIRAANSSLDVFSKSGPLQPVVTPVRLVNSLAAGDWVDSDFCSRQQQQSSAVSAEQVHRPLIADINCMPLKYRYKHTCKATQCV